MRTKNRFMTYFIVRTNIQNTNVSDLIKIKGFCEDILRIVNQLGVGECSLKGFLAHNLYTTRNRLQQIHSQKELNERKSETNDSV